MRPLEKNMAAIWTPESFITAAGSTPLSWAIGMAVMLLFDGPSQEQIVMHRKGKQNKFWHGI